MPIDVDPEKMEEIENSGETWIIDFWADWCKPCHKLEPIFESVSEKFDDVNFGKVDMEAHQSIGNKFGVRALPTMIIVEGGDEVTRTAGVMQEEQLENWIEDNT